MTDSTPLPEPGHNASRPRSPGEAASGRQAQAAQLAELIERCSRGHEDAFAELYDLTSARIYGLIVRVLQSPEQSAEVTPDVYVEIWRLSARYSAPKGSVLAWMSTIAHRRAVDRVRSVSSDAARKSTPSRRWSGKLIPVEWCRTATGCRASKERHGLAYRNQA